MIDQREYIEGFTDIEFYIKNEKLAFAIIRLTVIFEKIMKQYFLKEIFKLTAPNVVSGNELNKMSGLQLYRFGIKKRVFYEIDKSHNANFFNKKNLRTINDLITLRNKAAHEGNVGKGEVNFDIYKMTVLNLLKSYRIPISIDSKEDAHLKTAPETNNSNVRHCNVSNESDEKLIHKTMLNNGTPRIYVRPPMKYVEYIPDKPIENKNRHFPRHYPIKGDGFIMLSSYY